MMEILIIAGIALLSLTANIFLYKASINQLRKVDLYEKWIAEYEEWIGEFRNQLASTYLKMKNVDDRNLFVKDDDVGVVFHELLSLLNTLQDRVQKSSTV